ncbi:hypothetical protein CF54_21175 [Streptomyces sp. Tu 6176]|uniref:hypothetical protein n=1 Tax=Streptomyces sp. Tu 6176 TaxID=1470557 RepID=UPI00044FE4C4|nr:hypothetical protein [Streptomyces sp. Tu 6176]EYT81145.1 hypothetical protein CF54_21175 [Streptomyces sp. Tu 6176]
MRGLPARRVASTALCAALLAGIGGPAAMAADSARGSGPAAAPRAPLPNPGTLLGQVQNLAGLGGTLAPVRDLVTAVLDPEQGVLSAADTQKLGTAAKDALAQVDAALTAGTAQTAPAAATSTTPSTVPFAAAPAAPAAPVSTGVLLPVAGTPRVAAPRAADPTSDALAAVRKALDGLLKAIAAGDSTQVLPATDSLVKELTALVGTGLPTGGLSTQPAASGTDPAATASTLPALTDPVAAVPDLQIPDVQIPEIGVPDTTVPEAPSPAATVPAAAGAAGA